MATIAEIIAAKKAAATAAANAQSDPYASAPPQESIAERLAHKAAIDAIDPPGKSDRAAVARKAAGLILSKDMPCPPKGEPRGQATPIAGPPEERALAVTQGEVIDLTPANSDPATEAWHSALSSLQSELCVMRDPSDQEACWLALRSVGAKRRPLLLHRLPWLLWSHPEAPLPPNEPF